MDDVKKMLRAVINGQSTIKSELKGDISKLEKKIDAGFRDVNEKIETTNERIDKLGKSLAYLEDDAPTREEYDRLNERVGVIEEGCASA